jgi:ribosome modulation factor
MNLFEIPKRDVDYAYRMGYDNAINGANQTNCHFSIFSSRKNTDAWERGNADGKKELEDKETK